MTFRSLTRRQKLSVVASAQRHIYRATAHALLGEMPECKTQGRAACRELRLALIGLNGLDTRRLNKGWARERT